MSTDQDQGLRILDNALWRIAHHSDCDYLDVSDAERPKPCPCPRCVAREALEAAKDWRFHGALHERTESGHWPREVKMHAAWMKLASGRGQGGADPDHLLSQILREGHAPSVRDWYVATSVIQWLATNVGMTVLEAAGFTYQQWDQDRADGALFQRRQERESAPASPAVPPAAIAAQHVELRADLSRLEREVIAARSELGDMKADREAEQRRLASAECARDAESARADQLAEEVRVTKATVARLETRLNKGYDTLFAGGYDQALCDIRDHFAEQGQPEVIAEIDKRWGDRKRDA